MSSVPTPKISIRWYALSAIALLLIIGGMWWNHRATDPRRVFNAMLRQSLSTSAVTVQTAQTGNGTSAKQWSQFSLGAQNISHSITVLEQAGTTVTDENIGTGTDDYTRYKNIVTNQKGPSGKPLDVSKVLGVWAASKNNTTGGTLLSQTILGTTLPVGGMVIPIGNLAPAQRSSLLQEIAHDKVYDVSYKDVQRKRVNGREQYSYNVSILPEQYVRLFKHFAADVGLHDLDRVDPTNYKGQQALKMVITVDAHAQHTTRVALAASNFGQDYVSYDVPVQVTVPKNTVTTAELQKRLTQIR